MVFKWRTLPPPPHPISNCRHPCWAIVFKVQSMGTVFYYLVENVMNVGFFYANEKTNPSVFVAPQIMPLVWQSSCYIHRVVLFVQISNWFYSFKLLITIAYLIAVCFLCTSYLKQKYLIPCYLKKSQQVIKINWRSSKMHKCGLVVFSCRTLTVRLFAVIGTVKSNILSFKKCIT